MEWARTDELRPDGATLSRKVKICRRERRVALDAEASRVEYSKCMLRLGLSLLCSARVVRDRARDVVVDSLGAEVHVAELELRRRAVRARDLRVVGRVGDGLKQRQSRAGPLPPAVAAVAQRGGLMEQLARLGDTHARHQPLEPQPRVLIARLPLCCRCALCC